ncbi:hypothetical protein [Effusibacillus consociatus]|uniref:Uncharacterized protein n=1 Tax=Effusibacillus consociatus TaxID=1117041 RepID=A0ABV9PVM6_9BACL
MTTTGCSVPACRISTFVLAVLPLGGFPWHRNAGSHVPNRSLCHVHAASMPATIWTVCKELAGQSVGLKEIIQARNRRRRQLSQEVRDRSEVVDRLLAVHQPEPPIQKEESELPEAKEVPLRLKRYYNE